MSYVASTTQQPLRQYPARVTRSNRAGSFVLAILFLLLGLVPRWVGAIQDALMDVIGPPDPNYSKLEFYNSFGWILFAALGAVTLVHAIRSLAGNVDIAGVVSVYADRLEATRGKGDPLVVPFAATPFVRDLKWRSERRIELLDPQTGKTFTGIYPGLFATPAEYDDLSAVLQRAHSDFWLGADFPASIGRLELEFGGGRGAKVALHQGTLYYRGAPLPPGAVTGYYLAEPVVGLSVDQTVAEVVLDLAKDTRGSSVLLGADSINHKLSLIRILDAWGIPQR